jgi:hypothetical protein
MISCCRWTAVAVLALAACSCKPVGGADPLSSAQGSAAGVRPFTTNPSRVQDERFLAENHERAAESNEGNNFHGSVGMSTAAEW